MFDGETCATRTRDWPAAKGRPGAADAGDRKVLGARRAVLASKHSLQPGELAGGVAQATIYVQPSRDMVPSYPESSAARLTASLYSVSVLAI
jgi:hypothetical protein